MNPLPLLLVAASADPVAAAAPAKTKLEFRWPSPLRCEVERERTVTMDAGPSRSIGSARFQLDAKRGPSGWEMRTSGFTGSDAASAAARHQSFKVEMDGAFAGLLLDGAAGKMLADPDKRMAEATSKDQRPGAEEEASSGKNDWHDVVEKWAKAEMQQGVAITQEYDSLLDLPFVGPTSARSKLSSVWKAWVPCETGGPPNCARLEASLDPDLAAMNRAVTARIDKGKPGKTAPPGMRFARMQITKVLTTDPRTLVPRRLVVTTELEMAVDPSVQVKLIKKVRKEEIVTYRCKPPR